MKPQIVLRFDSAYSGVHDLALPYLESKGLKASVFLSTYWIGTSGRSDIADIQDFVTAGWDVGIRTYNQPYLDVLSEAQARANWESAIAYHEANGLGTPKTCAAPSRRWSDDLAIWSADYFEGASILSQNDNLQPLPFENDHYVDYGVQSINTLLGITTPAYLKGLVDTLINAGDNNSLHFLWHDVQVDGLVNNYTQAYSEFTETIDYIAEKRDAGLIDVKTFYELILAQRYRNFFGYSVSDSGEGPVLSNGDRFVLVDSGDSAATSVRFPRGRDIKRLRGQQ